eukprot:12284724-Alexandrium_andersonii.AAC.1
MADWAAQRVGVRPLGAWLFLAVARETYLLFASAGDAERALGPLHMARLPGPGNRYLETLSLIHI